MDSIKRPQTPPDDLATTPVASQTVVEKNTVATSVEHSENHEEPGPRPSKGVALYISLGVIASAHFLAALDLTAVSTILPTISKELNAGSKYIWVGSAYALSSTAILPLSGALADVFGRKPIMLCGIALFTLGSALAGAAQNIGMIIAARTLQGLGGRTIENLCDIIISDLVPLAERGIYQGLFALVYSLACGIGPPIGGIFSAHATWRWLFYLNLPICGIAFVLIAIFLNVRTPEGSVRTKLKRVDWLGNLIIMTGITLAAIGLSWGGIRYPWVSVHVLVPLILGCVLVISFFVYEAIVPRVPTIPWDVVSARTSFIAYIGTFFHMIASISVIFFMPVYFQACLLASPIRSGINFLGIAVIIAPLALVAGIIVQVTQKYRPVIGVGWVLMTVGLGLLSILKSTSHTGTWVGFQLIFSIGCGLLWAGLIFPSLAPQPLSRAASALAFFNFVRSFGMTLGIAISSAVLQNQLKGRLPADFTSTFPAGVEIAFSAIAQLPTLEEPLRSQVRVAFAESLSIIWKVMIGMSALGMLSNLALQEIPMLTATDEKYGLQENQQVPDTSNTII